MKNLLTLSFVLIITFLNAQEYQYLGAYTSNGTPLYLETPGDDVSVETQEMISNSLPESYPVPDYNPHYITSGYDTNIELQSNADIWVTFVSEGAGYRNVLGFYTYNINNPSLKVPSKNDITIIFPNVSALGSGGGLQVGDKVKIGSFVAGTGIGWVLLANAWSANSNMVGDGLWNLYSDPDFNPENNEDLRHHNVLLVDPDNERIILGFEDIRRDYSSCDNDFNDAVFYVTANPYNAIVTSNFADVSSASKVTSAYDGGLESNGNLASLIAKRNFKRKKVGNSKSKRALQQKFDKKTLKECREYNSLMQFLPETGMYKTEIAKVSSPQDLLGITNANEIFSVDYYQENERVSAVLATGTKGGIYDHSKVICDRLNSSSLEDIRTVTTRGHQIISSKIKRATGEVEYTLSFSIKLDGLEKELFSFWNIQEYPKGDYHNFQVWGSSFSQVFTLANHIIDEHTKNGGLKSTKVENVLPNVFVKSGAYLNGVINLNIVNKTRESSVEFRGSISQTEVSDRYDLNETLSLTGNYNDTLIIETGVLFDIGFSLETKSSSQQDALYLADGPWGLDFLDAHATVNEFAVNVTERNYSEEVYEIDRSPYVTGEVKGNINLFRHILPGDQKLDVKGLESVNFEIINNQPMEIVLMQEEERNWSNRIRFTVPKNLIKKGYIIPFSSFVDRNGKPVEIKNIKTIVFSIIGDYTNYVPYHLSIVDLEFGKKKETNTDNVTIVESSKLINYPNPFINTTMINLPESSEYIQIQVFDVLGRTIDYQELNTDETRKKTTYSNMGLTNGLYKYVVRDDKNRSHLGTFLIN